MRSTRGYFVPTLRINVMSKASARARDVTDPTNNYFTGMWTLDYKQLENIYMTTWVGKKIVELPNKFIFKTGFNIKIDGQDKSDLENQAMAFYKKRRLEKRVMQANAIKKIYGGAIILPKHKMQDPNKPYDISLFKGQEDLEFVVRDLTYLAVTPHTDLVSERYFEPERISLAGVTTLADNCILFKGIQVPQRRMPQFRYLGMSIFQNIFQALICDEYISKGIVNMVYRGNMKYYKLKGFSDLVKQGAEELAVEKIKLIEDYASLLSAGILDGEDDVSFVSQHFSALPEIDERSIQRLSAATNIPAVVLLGQNPDKTPLGGGNNDSELESFYNYIEEEQRDIEPEMEHLFKIICAIIDGKEHDVEITFNKPHNINPQVQVETDKIVLENMTAQQSLGFSDEIIKQYAVKNGIINQEQADTITEFRNEMLEMAELEAENNESNGKDDTKAA
jgi:phage-related protein (TIGR01555 family)